MNKEGLCAEKTRVNKLLTKPVQQSKNNNNSMHKKPHIVRRNFEKILFF